MAANVLFVCVENSCRSQIAEGFARTLGAGVVNAHSAGSRPSGKVNPTAVELMKEKGIDLGAQSSKGLADLPNITWDYVITMGCGDACPFVASVSREDWGLPDPKNLPIDDFRGVRDRIGDKVLELIRRIKGESHV